MRVDAAVRAEPVPCDAGVEPVQAQRVRALRDIQPRQRHRGDGAARRHSEQSQRRGSRCHPADPVPVPQRRNGATRGAWAGWRWGRLV